MSKYKTEISITDFRALIKELKKINPTYVNEFYMGAKEITKPVQSAIIKGIPASAPVRGMRGKSQRQRLGWGIARRAKSTQIRVNRTVKRTSAFARGRTNQYSIAYVAVRSPGTVLADMAGKSGSYTNNKKYSRKYEINLFGRGVIERNHKINGQGLALISALNSVLPKPSRFIWPAALRALPNAKKQVDRLLTRTNNVINKNLRRVSGK